MARTDLGPGHRCPRWPSRLGLVVAAAQELGRLPWLAAPFLRAFFFRALLAMVTSSWFVGAAAARPPRRETGRVRP